MLIDWFTVVAQILNFLILVWLLKRFLYRPILNAVDERERRIRAQLEEAAARNDEAEKQRTLYLQKNEIFEEERATMLKTAEADVKAERQRMLESAHRDYDLLWSQKLNALEEEERALQQEVIQKTKDEVYETTRKILLEMASSSLEEQMTASFIRQMEGLSAAEKDTLVQSFRSSRMPVILRSAFELREPQRDAIRQLIDRMLDTATPVTFETSPELISGVELISNGYKVAWSLADTLAASGKHAERVLRERHRPIPQEGEECHDIKQSPTDAGAGL